MAFIRYKQDECIKSPCKIGDTAYFISSLSPKAKIIETKVEKLVYYGTYWTVYFCDTFDFLKLNLNGEVVFSSSRNNLLFLSEEEAEVRLKELKNNF